MALTSHTGVLTLGGNNLSTTYTGVIGGAVANNNTTINPGTGSVIKVGTGTQTFGGPTFIPATRASTGARC